MTATNEHGETVRGFRVGLKSRGRKMLLPCAGEPLYTGEQALKVLEDYTAKRPFVEVCAITYSDFAGHEVLDLAEMRELYGAEVSA